MTTHRVLLGSHAANILDHNGHPVLNVPKSWNGFPLERKEIPEFAECGPQYSGIPTIMASKIASGRRWYRCLGKTLEMQCTPGVDVIGATYERDYGRWECRPGGETVCMRFPPAIVQRYLQDDAFQFDLKNQYAVNDDFLTQTLFTLAEELQHGLPNGSLYSEGLCLTVLGWLNRHYARHRTTPTATRKLSSAKQARVREVIETELGAALSIERLANEIGVSPSHFARLFRLSFGTSPHQYVLQKRIEQASRVLRSEQNRSVTDIALSLGFSSQNHFSAAFKGYFGQTPSDWRRE